LSFRLDSHPRSWDTLAPRFEARPDDALAQRIGPGKQEITRMGCKHWMLLVALAAAGFAGCQGSTDSGQAPSSSDPQPQSERADTQTAQGPAPARQVQTPPIDTSTPAGATAVFLDALRRGNDQTILQMYTERARQQAGEVNQHFAPRGSDTARFEIGQVEAVGENGARTACTWTDLDQDGRRHTLEFVWMLRREAPGWRVAGMAATPFPGEPPVLLDFENLRETMRKVDLLEEEIRRRQEATVRQAQQAKKSETPPLR
jgi:hypothetical protein